MPDTARPRACGTSPPGTDRRAFDPHSWIGAVVAAADSTIPRKRVSFVRPASETTSEELDREDARADYTGVVRYNERIGVEARARETRRGLRPHRGRSN